MVDFDCGNREDINQQLFQRPIKLIDKIVRYELSISSCLIIRVSK